MSLIHRIHRRPLRRPFRVAFVGSVATALLATTGVVPNAGAATNTNDAAAIRQLVREAMASQHLKAVIVSVTVDGKPVLRQAFGESMPGVPARTNMTFRNGAVAFQYLGNLLMQFVDEGKVTLDDTIDQWLPDLPDADKVTLKMLANQTAGYPDFEQDPKWIAAYYADPFHIWNYEERLQYVLALPRPFAPGANWSYSHSNFMILGEALAKIGQQPLAKLLQTKVLGPLGLAHTVESVTAATPPPVLHSFSGERRDFLQVPATTPFYEETTTWNGQWGTPMGANQTSTVDDLVTTAVAIGTGKLLTKSSFHAMTDPNLLGFGTAEPACIPECFPQSEYYNFGLGVVRQGSWVKQNPALAGVAAVEGYLRSKKIAIAVVNTFDQAYYEATSPLPANPANSLFVQIATLLASNDAPPTRS